MVNSRFRDRLKHIPFRLRRPKDSDVYHENFAAESVPTGYKFEPGADGWVFHLHDGETCYSLHAVFNMGQRCHVMLLKAAVNDDLKTLGKASLDTKKVEDWFENLINKDLGIYGAEGSDTSVPKCSSAQCCDSMYEMMGLGAFSVERAEDMVMEDFGPLAGDRIVVQHTADPDGEDVEFRIVYCPFCSAKIESVGENFYSVK